MTGRTKRITVSSAVVIPALLFATGWLGALQQQIASPRSQPQDNTPAQNSEKSAVHSSVIEAPPAAARLAPSPRTTSEYTISENVNLVLLDVSVKDKKGGYVSGLPKEDFTVLEDGKPQPITQFADNDIPVTAGLVVDNSGSMSPKKPDVITAALVFIQSSNPLDELVCHQLQRSSMARASADSAVYG